jgi:hypothetical protein
MEPQQNHIACKVLLDLPEYAKDKTEIPEGNIESMNTSENDKYGSNFHPPGQSCVHLELASSAEQLESVEDLRMVELQEDSNSSWGEVEQQMVAESWMNVEAS